MTTFNNDIKDKFLQSIRFVECPTLYLPDARTAVSSGTKPSSKSGEDLSIKALTLLAVPIPPRITDLYEMLNINRTKGSRLIKNLINSGFIIQHQYHPSRAGGSIKLLEITPTGWQKLKPLGIDPPSKLIQGSWEHNLCGAVLSVIGKQQKYKVLYEVPVGPEKTVRIDVIWENEDGKRIYWQCGVSSHQREAQSIIKALEVPAIRSGQLALLCKNKNFGNQVSKLLNAKSKYVSIKLISDALDHYYKKTGESLL
ncbi:MAG: MarR family winged helix-turn-helix transcriptional regulator [Phycisphaerae bacterium]|nr:MarR family winged helix-turn-helix transcriptional regulator [Phycisphaerae bacterium]